MAALFLLSIGLIVLTVLEPVIGLGLLFALLLAIFTSIHPAWLFTIIYPLLISIGQIPLSVGGTVVSLERLLVLIGSVGFLGGVFITKQIKLKKIPMHVFLGVFIWWACYMVSGLLSSSSVGWTILFGYTQKILLAYMVYISINTPREFSTALRAYLFSGIVASSITLIAYFEYGSLYIIREASYQSGQSLGESLFQGLARAGTGNAMFIWLALLLFQQAESKRSRILWGTMIFWFGVINLFALRRELLLTIPLGLIFLAWRNMLGNRALTIFISVLFFSLASWFISSSPEWQSRLLIETAGQFSSSQDPRLNMLLKFTPAAFMASPWFGYGPGNYAVTQLLFPGTMPYYYLRHGGSAAHNAWSATLVEAGIFSFLGLCLFLYGLGKPLRRHGDSDEHFMMVLKAFAPLIFLQLLFTMFFGHALVSSVIWFWFGFLLALSQHTKVTSEPVYR